MRLVLRLLAALLALALGGIGVIVVIEVITTAVGGDHLIVPYHQWLDTLRARSWNDLAVRLIAGAVVLFGLILLLVGLAARDRRLMLRSDQPEVTLWTSRRAVSRVLRARAEGVGGVGAVRTRIRPRRIRVRAMAPLQDPGTVRRELEESLTGTLAGIPWQRQPALRLDVRGGGTQ